MAQFGAGSDLAAQCPRVPTPDGWRPWLADVDGVIPNALAARAQAIAADQNIPLGVTESYPLPGVTTLIRLEPRSWERDGRGAIVPGCFRVGAIFLPMDAPQAAGAVVPPSTSSSGLDKLIGGLTVASLTIGIIATVAHLKGSK